MKSRIAAISSALGLEDFRDGAFAIYCGALRIALALMAWTSQADLLSAYAWQSPLQAVAGVFFLITSTAALVGWGGPAGTLLLAASLIVNRQVIGVMDARNDLLYQHTMALAIIAFILSFSPSFGSLSLFPRRNRFAWTTGRTLFLLRTLTLTIYLFATYHKIVPALDGRSYLLSILVTNYTGSLGFIQPEHDGLIKGLALAVGALELAIVAGLLIPRARRMAILAAVAYHLLLYPILPVHVFSVLMIALLTSFLSADQWDGILRRLRGGD